MENSITQANKKHKKMALSLILQISGLIILLSILTALIGYRAFTSVLEQQYNSTAFEFAQTALDIIDPENFDRYLETGVKDEKYLEIEKRLDDLVVSGNLNFIYVIKVDTETYSTSTYIYDSVNPATGFDRYELGYVAQDLDPQYMEEVSNIINTGERTSRYLYSYSESGAHTTAPLGVKDADGNVIALLCVEKTMDVLQAARSNYVRQVLTIAAILLLLAIVLYSLYLNKQMIRPIEELTQESLRFAENQDEPAKDLPAVRNRYEIGALASSVLKMEHDIIDYVENLTKVTAEKERIGAELNVATQIQADMLPRIFPPYPNRKEFDLYASMTPAKEVGGDFYDFFLVDDDHLAMVMADVSGKGVPAALFMVIAKTMIKNRTLMGGTPSEILADVNDQLCEGNDAELFVTVWLGILQISTGEGKAANAGHEHPALMHKNGEFELVVYRHSPAVATMEGIPFKEHDFKLEPGDRLFVYTDGVAEATNAENELFGSDRMLEALNRNPNGEPEEVLKNVMNGIDEFVAGAQQFDDITMLCLHYVGPQGE